MKISLLVDLMRFAFSKNTTRERVLYVVLSLIYFSFLARTLSQRAQAGDSASSSQAGDDIYPLF